MSFNLMHIIAVYFLFIFVFSEPRYRVHSAIILLFTSLNIYFELPVSNSIEEYIANRSINISWDGVTAVALTMCFAFDKLAVKQALLLAFAITCHTVIIYDLTIASSVFSNFFYTWYDELIIVVGLLQMGVSYNGFTTALSNLQKLLPRIVFYSHGVNKSLPIQEKRETKS